MKQCSLSWNLRKVPDNFTRISKVQHLINNHDKIKLWRKSSVANAEQNIIKTLLDVKYLILNWPTWFLSTIYFF